MLITSKTFLEFIKQCDNIIAKALWVLTEDTDVMHLYPSINEYLDAKSLYFELFTTKAINHININQYDQLTFLPSNKEHIVNSLRSWNPKNRQQTTAQRLIRKLLTVEGLKHFKEKEIDDFGKCFDVYVNEDKYTFQILNSDSIPVVYDYDIEHMEYGSLCESCMRNMEYEIFDIYIAAGAKIITLHDRDEYVARALLWNVYVEELDKEITFMDRIYSYKESHQKAMQLFAKKQGFYQKAYQSSDSKTLVVSPEGKVQVFTMSVKVPGLKNYNVFPYVDTFTLGDSNTNTLHNVMVFDKSQYYNSKTSNYEDHGIYTFNETDGDYGTGLNTDYIFSDDSYKETPFYDTKSRNYYTLEEYNKLNYDFFTGI